MDKETLSNYGWIVICTLVLAVMIALATPFGEYIKAGVESTVNGLYDVNNKALGVVYEAEKPLVPGATFTDGTFLSWDELKTKYDVTDTNINEDAFASCSTLLSISIPETVTTIGNYAFFNCNSLTNVSIPQTVSSIGANAFRYCSSLVVVSFSGTVEQWNNKITKGIGLFVSAPLIKEITCSDGTVAVQ